MTNELSMQELLEQQEQELNKVQVGQTITGKISRINNDELVLDLDYGFDGVIKIEELNLPKGKYASEVYKVGDEITAIITRVYQKDGIINLSKLYGFFEKLINGDPINDNNMKQYIKQIINKKD